MEITFKDIIGIIKKSIVFIIITSILFALVSYFYTSFFIPKTYTTKVKLCVVTTYEANGSGESLNDYRYAEQLVATYIQILDSNSFYSKIADNLNNKYTANQIGSKISFTPVEGTEVFIANIVSKSPTEAKEIADAVAAIAPEIISNTKRNAELKIIDPGKTPNEPSAPKPQKSAMTAFLVGLAVSLIIAFIRDYFDVKIKYSEDMTVLCDLPVLAAIPDFELFVDSTANKGAGSKRAND